jgi:hypothetical protein
MFMLWFGSQMFHVRGAVGAVELTVLAWPFTLVASERAGVSVFGVAECHRRRAGLTGSYSAW